jgi:hypothetical protein
LQRSNFSKGKLFVLKRYKKLIFEHTKIARYLYDVTVGGENLRIL